MTASPLLYGSFVALCFAVFGAIVWALKTWLPENNLPRNAALAITAVFVVTAGVAQTGVLLNFEPPPKLLLLLVVMMSLTLWLSIGRLGTQLSNSVPLWFIIGLNAFRFPLELIMHRAYTEGVMPVQMSYSGRNYDILTGVLAIAAAVWLKRGAPSWVAAAWNAIGFVLLVNIVGIAILSMPVPFRMFHGDLANVWVAYPPFVWLPAFLVQLALCSHILVFRALRQERRAG